MNNNIRAKESRNNALPTFRNKVFKVLDSGKQNTTAGSNPYLDKDGNLKNPYLDYQKILDNPVVSTKVKDFISQATGLSSTKVSAPTPGRSTKLTTTTVSSAKTGNNSSSNTTSNQDSKGSSYKGNNIAEAAKQYMGTPYVWGGESMAEGGMDCSGFVYNALKDAGRNVGRTTAQGYRSQGKSVSKSDMKPGDLVFYGKNGNASHVGIYIGNGQIIHSAGGSKNTASNPGKGVSVVNIDHRSDFLEARRV